MLVIRLWRVSNQIIIIYTDFDEYGLFVLHWSSFFGSHHISEKESGKAFLCKLWLQISSFSMDSKANAGLKLYDAAI